MTTETEKPATFDGRIDSHPLHKAIYDLCQEIEKLPASEQATIAVSAASALQDQVAALRFTVGDNTRCLKRYAEECFPRAADGKVHFARAIMESVAEDLDAAFKP